MSELAEHLDDSIRSAKRAMHEATSLHDKQMEFWNGYLTAMEEIKRSHGGDDG